MKPIGRKKNLYSQNKTPMTDLRAFYPQPSCRTHCSYSNRHHQQILQIRQLIYKIQFFLIHQIPNIRYSYNNVYWDMSIEAPQ